METTVAHVEVDTQPDGRALVRWTLEGPPAAVDVATGTTPEHIRAIKERCGGHNISERPAPRPPHVSSMIAAAPLVQEPAPTIVGERVNSQGSRKAKELLLADDYDGLLQVAEQILDDRLAGDADFPDAAVERADREWHAEPDGQELADFGA